MVTTILDPLFNIFRKQDRQDLTKLEARAYLDFFYPIIGPEDSYKLVRIPLYENPEIIEDKSAKYVNYMPLGRSSELFSYVGASARSIKLKFNLNLLHLMNYNINIDRFKALITGDTIQTQQEAFFKSKELEGGNARANFAGVAQKEYNAMIKSIDPVFAQKGLGNPYKNKVLEAIIFWVNIIRTCVSNNSESTLYGPPVIRLTFGALHRNVPYICSKYNITFDDVAGYDLRTLWPRLIKVSLDLMEIRTGDFGEFIPGDRVKRDNLAGWEAVLSDTKGTIDPQPYLYKRPQEPEE